MRLVEPASILWEDHKGERHIVKQIVAYGRTYKFYRESEEIILKETIQ
jgi:hypothetical protein